MWQRSSTWSPFALALLAAGFGSACTPSSKAPDAAAEAPAPQASAPVAAAGVDAATLPSPPAALPVPDDPRLAEGQEMWVKYCALCHGKDREGYAADNAPSLRSKQFLQTATIPFLRVAIERGRPGTAMAGYARNLGGPLTPTQVDTLIAWIRRDAPPAVNLPLTPIQGDAANGSIVYVQQCQTCHGTPMQRADAVHLYNPMLLGSALDSYLEYAIVHGRDGTRMEAWQNKLTAQQIKDVVAWLRSQAKPVQPMPATPPGAPGQPVQPGQPGPAGVLPAGQPGAAAAQAPTPAASPTITEEPVEHDPIVINPKGGKPSFTNLRENRFVPIDQVAQALKDKKRIIIIDARAGSDWKRMHITGSISRPYYDKKRLDDIPNDGTWVIAYCACPHHASGEVVDELKRRGYPNVGVLDEGVFAWQQKGYPIVAEPGAVPVPAPPPVPGHEGHNHGPGPAHGQPGHVHGAQPVKPAPQPIKPMPKPVQPKPPVMPVPPKPPAPPKIGHADPQENAVAALDSQASCR